MKAIEFIKSITKEDVDNLKEFIQSDRTSFQLRELLLEWKPADGALPENGTCVLAKCRDERDGRIHPLFTRIRDNKVFCAFSDVTVLSWTEWPDEYKEMREAALQPPKQEQ